MVLYSVTCLFLGTAEVSVGSPYGHGSFSKVEKRPSLFSLFITLEQLVPEDYSDQLIGHFIDVV